MHDNFPPCKASLRFAAVLLLAIGGTSFSALAGWKLIEEGACEGPIVSLSMGHLPEDERCTQATAGKAALCYTEVCQAHCLYFDYALDQCKPGADLGKRYTCEPD
jgi:hypothetical protein